jgi:cell wall-associated NlpC family hydrolase
MRVRPGTRPQSIGERIAHPSLLMRSALGIGVVMALAAPHGTPAQPLRSVAVLSAAKTSTGSPPRLVHSYEHYVSLVKAQAKRARRAVRFAYRQIGKPYRWGGAGPRSYDCSGLAMAAWRRAGLRLPHRADLQHRAIRRKVPLKHLRPGDLVFFSGNNHVGIYVGRRRFIHAPHTGTVVRRGSLSGWRLRSFAGAARPGAPAYRAWPDWVRAFGRSGPRRPIRRVEPRPEHRPLQGGSRLPYGADPGRLPESQIRQSTP